MDDQQMSDEQSSSRSNGERNATIRIKTLTDRHCDFRVDLSAPITQIRDEIHEKMGVAIDSQRIIFQGKVLSATRSLASYGVGDGLTVHLVDRPPPTQRRTEPRRDNPNQNSRNQVFPQDEMGLFEELLANGPVVNMMPRLNNISIEQSSIGNQGPTNQGPPRVRWRMFVAENEFALNRDLVERIVRQTISAIPYLNDDRKSAFQVSWTNNELRIDLPTMTQHVASPAFERLLIIESHVYHVREFIDIVTEENGLLSIVRDIVARGQEALPLPLQTHLRTRLNEIALRLDSISRHGYQSSNCALDRLRNSTETQRNARIENVEASRNNNYPEFIMRHAIDVDLTTVMRAMRQEQMRFFDLESVLEDVIESGIIHQIGSNAGFGQDYREIALGLFYSHVMRRRHILAHCIHTSTEIEVPFVSPTKPQRLLPQYDLSNLSVPHPHSGSLVISMRPSGNSETSRTAINSIFTAPRRTIDVGNLRPGEWSYLTFYPTGIMQEHHEVAIPAVLGMGMSIDGHEVPLDVIPDFEDFVISGDIPNEAALNANFMNNPNAGVHVGIPNIVGNLFQGLVAPPPNMNNGPRPPADSAQPHTHTHSHAHSHGHAHGHSHGHAHGHSHSASPISVNISAEVSVPRSGSAPFMPRMPDAFLPFSPAEQMYTPSGEVNREGSPRTRSTRPSGSTSASRQQRSTRRTRRPEVDMTTARGPSTQTLSPLPTTLPPSELHSIAQNIASRYREEALQRISDNITRVLKDQTPAWDVRLSSAPLITQRQMLALALELLTSSGRDVEQSKDMMLALVQDEKTLCRAIVETMRALFVQNSFPTHLDRLILPRVVDVNARSDYEPREEFDDDDGDYEVGPSGSARLASDIVQPQQGSLRDLANQRAARRQALQARGRRSSPEINTGLSLSFEDHLEIARTGRLPEGPAAVPQEEGSVSTTATPAADPSVTASVPSQTDPSTTHPAAVRSTTTQPTAESATEQPRSQPAQPTAPRPPAHPQQPVRRFFGSLGPRTNSNSNIPGLVQMSRENQTDRAQLMTQVRSLRHYQQLLNGNNQENNDEGEQRRPTSRISRTTISIDPFLSCTSRHSDMVRANGIPERGRMESNRMTNLSRDPHPNLTTFLRGLSIPEREAETAVSEADYTYEVERHTSGELILDNEETFRRVLNTAFRSLFGHLIETDAIITLNSVSFMDYPSRTDVRDMLDGHFRDRGPIVQAVFPPVNLNANSMPPRPGSAPGPGEAEALAAAAMPPPDGTPVVYPRRINAFDAREFSHGSLPDFSRLAAAANGSVSVNSSEYEIPPNHENPVYPPRRAPQPPRNPNGSVSSETSLEQVVHKLHQYIKSHPVVDYPRSLLGLIMELVRGRVGPREAVQMLQYDNAVRIIGNLQSAIRHYLIDNQMNGNATPSSDDLQAIAGRIAGDVDFFAHFFASSNFPESSSADRQETRQPPNIITLDGTRYNASILARRVEVDTTCALLSLALQKIDKDEFARRVLEELTSYIERILALIYLHEDREFGRIYDPLYNTVLHYCVRHMYSEGQRQNSGDLMRIIDRRPLINYLMTFFHESAVDYMKRIAQSSDEFLDQTSNKRPSEDVQNPADGQTQSEASSSNPASSSLPRTEPTEEGVRMAKRRKRDSGPTEGEGSSTSGEQAQSASVPNVVQEMECLSNDFALNLEIFDEPTRMAIMADIRTVALEGRTFDGGDVVNWGGKATEIRETELADQGNVEGAVDDALRLSGPHSPDDMEVETATEASEDLVGGLATRRVSEEEAVQMDPRFDRFSQSLK